MKAAADRLAARETSGLKLRGMNSDFMSAPEVDPLRRTDLQLGKDVWLNLH
jgi:hypothetical protein